MRIENLSAALAKDSALIEKHLGKYAHTASNTFAALNQAFFSDGAFIFVPQGVEVAEPVQLIYISSAKQSGETILPRNLVIAEANSKLTVVESYISTGNVAYFTNAVTEILAGDNAAVEHIKLAGRGGGRISHRDDRGRIWPREQRDRPFFRARRKIVAHQHPHQTRGRRAWNVF